MATYWNEIINIEISMGLLSILVLCFSLCCFFIRFSLFRYNARIINDSRAVQSAHNGPVVRAGGLAIYLSLLFIIPLSQYLNIEIKPFSYLLLSACVVFGVGFLEDLGFGASPLFRISGAIFSGILVIFFYQVWLVSIAIPGVDYLLSFAPIGIAFTIFATSGVVNAFNLVDGLNGLSSYISGTTAFALYLIAVKTNQLDFSIFLLLVIFTTMGFMILNFPFGIIFLGDAGAYLLGHILVWAAIILIVSSPQISPFSILLIFFWPVADTFLALWRRWKNGVRADNPDRLHFHQLTMRLIEIRLLGRSKRYIANPLTTLVLMPLISAPQVMGVLYYNDVAITVLSSIVFSSLFVICYFGCLWLAKGSSSRI